MFTSKALTNISPQFRTIKITENDAEYITENILNFWQTIAANKKDTLGITKEAELFSTSYSMASRIFCQIDPYTLKNPEMHLYLCRDQNNHPQALILFFQKETSIEIDTLLTNPRNLRSLANASEKNKTQGAGTFLLKIAESFAKRKGLNVELSFTDVAKGFYIKNGYTLKGSYGVRMMKAFHEINNEP
jgi:hypothetical protein